MSHSREFDTVASLVSGGERGFVIFDQCVALGNGRGSDDESYLKTKQRLKEASAAAISEVSSLAGEPSQTNVTWDIGVPVWASGGAYGVWKLSSKFVAVFISWDNPEDPSFVIVAQADLGQFDSDHICPSPDPWEAEWMSKGVW